MRSGPVPAVKRPKLTLGKVSAIEMNPPPSTGLHLHTGNLTEGLAEQLAEWVGTPTGPDPLVPETIVVQSPGMARWLQLQLAEQLGVAFNLRFPFPRSIVEELLQHLNPGDTAPAYDAYAPAALTLRFYEILDALPRHDLLAPLRQYLDPGAPLPRAQLARQLAGLFDSYLVYRPDWLIKWGGEAEPRDWQAWLWQTLVAEIGHPPVLLQVKEQAGKAAHLSVSPFPHLPRLAVFGISTLPPLFLEAFQIYARFHPVHLFLLQPGPHYLADPAFSKAPAAPPASDPEAVAAEWFRQSGKQAAGFQSLLVDLGFQQREQDECFAPPRPDNRLRRVQSLLYHLGAPEEPAPSAVDETEFSSVQLEVCHSPMRELEVLHQRLLFCFEKLPGLRPRDVLVMAPSIEDYVPYIEAVFGHPEEAGLAIPYRLSDRTSRAESPGLELFCRWLELVQSRLPISETMGLLETPAARVAYPFSETELEQLRAWLSTSGVRWGIDADHRTRLGLPSFDENSFASGIRRLLLGYAMPGGACWQNIDAANEPEGKDGELLGRFLVFWNDLARAAREANATRPLAEWANWLREAAGRLLPDPEVFRRDWQTLNEALLRMQESTQAADLPTVVYLMRETFGARSGRGEFMTGGVTFCALTPMRSVPARVICLLGMGDEAFPRSSQPPAFDEMAHHPRPGDRSPREDDRLLFLETLLSARDLLYISYPGISAHDLSISPPSVVVNELLQVFDEEERRALVRHNRLQPFHPDEFGPPSPRSYSRLNWEACRSLQIADSRKPSFNDVELAEPDAALRHVELSTLIRFFKNPAQTFVKERLQANLDPWQMDLADEEPLTLDALLRSRVLGRLFEAWDPSSSTPPPSDKFLREGGLPPGTMGKAALDRVIGEFQNLTAKAGANAAAGPEPPVEIDVTLDEFRLTGKLGPVIDGCLFMFFPKNVDGRTRLEAWIKHLAFNAARPESNSRVITRDKVQSFPGLSAATVHLAQLLELYWRGLREPIPFAPEMGFQYASTGKLKEEVFDQDVIPEKSYTPSSLDREVEDPWFKLVWGDRDASDGFERLGKEVFDAYISHVEPKPAAKKGAKK